MQIVKSKIEITAVGWLVSTMCVVASSAAHYLLVVNLLYASPYCLSRPAFTHGPFCLH